MYKVKRFSQDSESKTESNAGKGAALIGGIGLAGTGGMLYHQNKSGIKKIEETAANELKEGRRKLARDLKIDRSEIAREFNRRNLNAKSNYKMDIADLADDRRNAIKTSKKNYESTLKHIENGGTKLNGNNIEVRLDASSGKHGNLKHNHVITQGGSMKLDDNGKQFYKDWAKDLKDETASEINKQARSEGKFIRDTYKSKLKSNKNKFIEDTTDRLNELRFDKRVLKYQIEGNKDFAKSKLRKSLIKNGAIGLAATGLAAGGYYLAKKDK